MIKDPNLQSIFSEAVARETDAAREEFLDEACGDRPELRARVEALLCAHSAAGGFFGGRTAQTEASPVNEQPGETIGPYKLREQIGEGGFGVVFVAEQVVPVRRKVALKVIKPGMDSKQVIARFEAERQALALMDHPNVARVLDAGTTETGRPYFAMELIHGVPITDFCDSQKLPTNERLRLFVDVCLAVQHAHQKGIIHRDIKPSNVMVTMHDHRAVAKVIDFGVAKALGGALTENTIYTAYGQMVGTPMYMSPEQAQLSGLDVDTRSDVYSLGVLAYELLTGSPPFDKESLEKAGFDEMRRIILEEQPRRPSVLVSTLKAEQLSTICDRRQIDVGRLSPSLQGELDWIVMKSLDKDRTRRYETAAGLADDVKRYLNGEAVHACPPTTAYRVSKFVQRNRAGVGVAAAMLLLLVAGIGGTTWQAVQATDQKNRAVAAEALAEQRLEESEDSRLAAVAAQQKAEAAVKEAEASRQKAEAARKQAEAACVAYLKQLRDLAATGAISQKECAKQLRAFPLQHANLLLLEAHDVESPLYKASPFRDEKWVAQIPLEEIETARTAVAEALEKDENVMQWIVMFGWTEEIRDHIIERVKKDAPAIDQHYFQLAVDLAEPELYPMLHEATLRATMPIEQINMLRRLPDYDLQETISQVWQQGDFVFSENEMAILAAGAGEPTALTFLIGMLNVAPEQWRDHVSRVVAFRGSDAEIVDWHRANHGQLSFDLSSGRFYLPGQEAPADLNDELHEGILKRWQKGEKALGKDALDAAVAAAEIGDRSALEYLLEKLRVPVVQSYSTNAADYYYIIYNNKHRNAVLQVLDVRGSNKEIIDWYNANKGKLVFDPVIDKFVLLEAK